LQADPLSSSGQLGGRIHFESDNGSSSDRGETNQESTRNFQCEMFGPEVMTRMEESVTSPCLGFGAVNLIGFVEVAGAAG
jgi:hypothetical protein